MKPTDASQADMAQTGFGLDNKVLTCYNRLLSATMKDGRHWRAPSTTNTYTIVKIAPMINRGCRLSAPVQ
jgi:hypothetical protein